MECAGCGLGCVAPSPPPDLIPTFYPKDYGPYAQNAKPPEREGRSLSALPSPEGEGFRSRLQVD